MNKQRCKFIKDDKTQCKGVMLLKDGFCRIHSPLPRKAKKASGRTGLNKRIGMKCLDCAVVPKEVTLCHLFDCPLWAVRFGYPLGNKTYNKRMKTAEKNYPEDFKELQSMGIDIADFYKEHPISIIPME